MQFLSLVVAIRKYLPMNVWICAGHSLLYLLPGVEDVLVGAAHDGLHVDVSDAK